MAFLHGKGAKVLVDDYDLSTVLSQAQITTTMDPAETTVFTNTSKTFLAGLRSGSINVDGLFEGDTDIDTGAGTQTADGLFSSLVSATADSAVTIAPKGLAATGERVKIMQGRVKNYDISSPVADVVKVSLALDGSSDSGAMQAGAPLSGYLIHTGTMALAGLAAGNITSTGVDTGEADAQTSGAVCVAHVTTNTADAALEIRVQDSPDGTSWADYMDIWPVGGKLAAGTLGNMCVSSQTSVDAQFRLRVPTQAGYTTGDIAITASIAILSPTQ